MSSNELVENTTDESGSESGNESESDLSNSTRSDSESNTSDQEVVSDEDLGEESDSDALVEVVSTTPQTEVGATGVTDKVESTPDEDEEEDPEFEEDEVQLVCEEEGEDLEWDDSDLSSIGESPSGTTTPMTPAKEMCFGKNTYLTENGSIVEIEFAPKQKEFKVNASTFLDTLWKCTRLDGLMDNFKNIVVASLEKKNGDDMSELILTVKCVAENQSHVWAITETRSLCLKNNGDYSAKAHFTSTRSPKKRGTRVRFNSQYGMSKTPTSLTFTRDFDASFQPDSTGKCVPEKLLFEFNNGKHPYSFLKMKYNMSKLKKSGSKPDLDDFYSHPKLRNFIKTTRAHIRSEIRGVDIDAKQALLG